MRRTRTIWRTLALVVLLAVIVSRYPRAQDAVRPVAAPSSSSAVATASDPAASLPANGSEGLIAATVTRNVDGDTLHVRTSAGVVEKVRFIGVDTPESTIEHEPYGKESSDYTRKRLPVGTRVWLETDVGLRDRYGRLLAYVWLSPPADSSVAELRAKMFNAQLLIEGYAQLMTIPPDVKYVDYFRPLQTEAREASRGLWGLPAR
jgi:micrococcal nuclease